MKLLPGSALMMFALWFIAVSAIAEPAGFQLSSTRVVSMPSELTGRHHELVISLPASYADNPDKKYPVLYFIDAYWDMPLLYSIYGNLVWDALLPELIMVGFSYGGDQPNFGNLRARDLTPTEDNAEAPGSGDAPKFLQFIKQQVLPYMAEHYRVNPRERALGGNSYGGLFTLYAMYQEPELFGRYIAISPAVIWDDNWLFQRDANYAEANKSLPARLFLSQGGDEFAPFKDPILEFGQQLQSRAYRHFSLLNKTIEGERHTSVKAEGYTRGLRWVFGDIAPTGPSGLEAMMTPTSSSP
ncbi:alpha/beta hydrolase [Gilvimarinus algae]|uniref:Alpha/beta hydrolase-fold protein n=1 Tax=Gilvimarinus algae TaxID=3058037 RepID=A0ABT8TDW3_9GAMM|nr:alpha/beta hydrolase-fold protein [Gilvimarinus sp. SDUM040014]MDO3381563.1 alpha/beta hydrolase-fold protein [Gilvimarinus sp. SDUM040014]